MFCGIALIEWRLESPDFTTCDMNDCGTLEYIIVRFIKLQNGVRVPNGFVFDSSLAALQAHWTCRLCALEGQPTTVDAFLKEEGIRCSRVFHCSREELEIFEDVRPG